MSPWSHVAVMSPLCRHVAMSPYRHVAISPCRRYVAISPYRHIAISPCRRYVAMTPLCRHVAVMSPLCRHVAMSPVCRAFPPSTSPSGEGNVKNLDLYFRYAAAYRHVLELTPHGGIESVSDRLRKQEWSEPAVDLLLHDRTMPDPVAFKHIAMSLKRIFRVRSGVGDESAGLRDYNAKDCANKWKSMFPTSQDAVATNNFLHHLREVMPGLKFLVEKIRSGAEINIGAIHIAWPWAKTCMEALQNSVFLDATFKITCYGYKLVFITTLDGNKQHRPLQTSFILYGHAEQWKRIFNFFAMYVVCCVPSIPMSP